MQIIEDRDLPFRVAMVMPGSAQENPHQYKEPTESQKAALRRLIFDPDGPGWAGVALINNRTVENGWPEEDAVPTFIDGHTRHEIAVESGEPIPAIIGEWTPEAERTLLGTLDPLGALSRIDPEAYLDLLETLPEQTEEVSLVLDKMAAQYREIDFLEEFGDGLDALEEDVSDQTGDGEAVSHDVIKIILYDFGQVEEIMSGVRQLADERGWEIDLELQ